MNSSNLQCGTLRTDPGIDQNQYQPLPTFAGELIAAGMPLVLTKHDYVCGGDWPLGMLWSGSRDVARLMYNLGYTLS